jgi:perosamine synthetase
MVPAMRIRLAKPVLEAEEEAAVLRVLRSGMLVQGPEVRAFEEALAAVSRRTFAVACSSGTAALELALWALDLPAGSEVLCPDVSWPSPAHAIVRAGLRPRLVDIDPASWNGAPEAFAKARGPRTTAAVVIDQFGMPAHRDALAPLLDGLPVVLDGACSLGGSYGGAPALAWGTLATTSFHPRKVLTTGEGGAVLTDDAALDARLRVLRDHGRDGRGGFSEAGPNLRMTDLAAALGRVQLGRLEPIVAARRALARRYRERLPDELALQQPAGPAQGNHQTLGVRLTEGEDRDGIVAGLRARDVEAGLLSFALHALDSLRPFADGPYPHAEALVGRGLALPLHPSMAVEDVDRVVATLAQVRRETGS